MFLSDWRYLEAILVCPNPQSVIRCSSPLRFLISSEKCNSKENAMFEVSHSEEYKLYNNVLHRQLPSTEKYLTLSVAYILSLRFYF
jgi:hypothetical protein